MPMVKGYPPTLSSVGLSVSGFIFRSLIHEDLRLFRMINMVLFAFIYMQASSLIRTIVKDAGFFPVCFSGFSIRDKDGYVGLCPGASN